MGIRTRNNAKPTYMIRNPGDTSAAQPLPLTENIVGVSYAKAELTLWDISCGGWSIVERGSAFAFSGSRTLLLAGKSPIAISDVADIDYTTSDNP